MNILQREILQFLTKEERIYFMRNFDNLMRKRAESPLKYVEEAC